ncbi:MAG: transposase [Armatimonadetes bacterium]|nr:transposase [Armatimonadota bacterium]
MSRGKRYTEDQIIKVLQEIEAGASIASVARSHGITEQTLYRWRERYGGGLPPESEDAERVVLPSLGKNHEEVEIQRRGLPSEKESVKMGLFTDSPGGGNVPGLALSVEPSDLTD